VTIVCHGGVADMLFQGLERIFKETDLIPEIIVHTLISKPQMTVVLDSVNKTGKLLSIEESSTTAGYGNEIISNVSLMSENKIAFKRIGSMPLPIPSVRSLEELVLPNLDLLIQKLKEGWND
jgi:pyruvate/2-oxoglutarate/acetoin dehydrogenase E1 component